MQRYALVRDQQQVNSGCLGIKTPEKGQNLCEIIINFGSKSKTDA